MSKAEDLRKQHAGDLQAWQNRRFDALQALARVCKTSGAQDAWAAGMDAALFKLGGHVQGALVAEVQKLLRLENQSLPTKLQQGFQIYGDVPVSGLWPRKWELEPASLEQALAEAKQARAQGDYRLPTRLEAQLFAEALSEVSLGRVSSPIEAEAFGETMGFGDDFVHNLFFGVEETPDPSPEDPSPEFKLRGCMSATDSKMNPATRLHEAARIPGLDGFVGTAQAGHRCHPSAWLRQYKADWKGGFKQLAVIKEQRRFQCFFLKADRDYPELGLLKGKIYGFCFLALCFGPRATPNCFCEVPHFIVSVAQLWLGLLVDSHVDDIFGSTTSDLGSHEYDLLVKLHDVFGFRLAPPSAGLKKRMPPRLSGEALGANFEMADPKVRQELGVLMYLCLPEDKARKYQGSLEEHERRQTLRAGPAKKLAGRFEFSGSISWGGSGRPFLKPIYERCSSSEWSLDPALRWSFLGLKSLSVKGVRRKVFCDTVHKDHKVLFTDARGRGEPWGTEALGSVLLGHWDEQMKQFTSPHKYTADPVDAELEKMLPSDRQQRINEAEALAVRAALEAHQAELAGCDVSIFIDSSAALGAIRNAFSGSVFLACTAGEIWLWADRHGCRLWFWQIPSKLNPADALSRLETKEARQKGWLRQTVPTLRWHRFSPSSFA